MDEIDIIADAVIAELNAQLGVWGYSGLTAVVGDAPLFRAEELEATKITVMVNGTKLEPATRGGTIRYRHQIDVDVRRKTGNVVAENRQLRALRKRIADHFLMLKLPTYRTAQCESIELSRAYMPDSLFELGIHAAMATLTFQTLGVPS